MDDLTQAEQTRLFLERIDRELTDVRNSIQDLVLRQQRILPIPGDYFLYGKLSINQELYVILHELRELVRTDPLTATESEIQMQVLAKKLIMHLIFRIVYSGSDGISGKLTFPVTPAGMALGTSITPSPMEELRQLSTSPNERGNGDTESMATERQATQPIPPNRINTHKR